MTDISTLIVDINGVLENGKQCDTDNVKALGAQIAEIVADRLDPEKRNSHGGGLRMSSIGRCSRAGWYQSRSNEVEQLQAHTRLKFLYGDILESLMLFLAKEAGHKVEAEQAEVNVGGVLGHIDAIIDGVVVDVKSASTFSFDKFKKGTLAEKDSFGYMDQLAGYSAGLDGVDGAFLAVDKTLGHITLLEVPVTELKTLDTEGRIEYLKGVMAQPEPPPREHNDVEEGASGNRKLPIECSYCRFKDTCWSDSNDGVGLRTFIYSNGPTYLTHVAKEPRVMEAFPVKKKEQ